MGVLYDYPNKKPPVATVEPDKKIASAHEVLESAWKALGALEFYRTGQMMGNTDGPDEVSLSSVLDRFSSLITELVKSAYTQVDKSIPKEVLDAFRYTCKAVSALETSEVSIPKIKMLAAVAGFADAYVRTSDAEMVRNLSLNNA